MPPRSAINQPPPKSNRRNDEALIQAAIMAKLGLLPSVRVFRNNIGVAVYEGGARVEYGVGGKGAPDLLCEVLHAPSNLWVALWLEVKTPIGDVEPDQKRWHAAARMFFRNVAVVRSVEDALAVVFEVRETGRVAGAWGVEVSRG